MGQYNEIIAKNGPGGPVTLEDHTKQVLNMAMRIADRNFILPSLDMVALAAILHDIGKCPASFQKYIRSGKAVDTDGLAKYRRHRHNTVSWAFAYSCITGMKKKRLWPVHTSVLYHHIVWDDPKTVALDVVRNLIATEPEAYGKMCGFYRDMLLYADRTFGLSLSYSRDYSPIEDQGDFNGETAALSMMPLHPKADLSLDINARYNAMEDYSMASLTRSLLVYCDREVSSGRHDNQRILANDTEYIDSIFDRHLSTEQFEPDYSNYDQTRLIAQKAIVDDIIDRGASVNVIPASAGFGKTLTGLMWFLKNGRKTLWVVPRNIIGFGTYMSVVRELGTMGLGDKVKVALFHTGKVQACNYAENGKCRLEDCDITVINIDGFLSYYSRNSLGSLLVDHYAKNVVIDEYHEMVADAPLFSAYINMLHTRMHHSAAQTLMLSATAVKLDNLLYGSESECLMRRLPSYIYGGDTKVNIKVVDKDTFDINSVPDNSFVVTTTVGEAQAYARLCTREHILMHSLHTEKDRRLKEEMLYALYGKSAVGGTHKPIVIATSILGVGLDLSAENLFDSPVSPEDTIQRLCGRTSRFREYDEVNYYVMVDKKDKLKNYIGSIYSWQLHKRWIAKLAEHDGQRLTKGDLYAMYSEFYEDNKELYESYLKEKYASSSQALSGITLKPGNSQGDGDEVCLPKGATYRDGRGNATSVPNSVFVTVRTEDGYMDPITVESHVFLGDKRYEDSSQENNATRYDYLTGALGKDGKYILRNGYGIRRPNEASVRNAAQLAFSNRTPLLLCDFRYTKEYGLEYAGHAGLEEP